MNISVVPKAEPLEPPKLNAFVCTPQPARKPLVVFKLFVADQLVPSYVNVLFVNVIPASVDPPKPKPAAKVPTPADPCTLMRVVFPELQLVPSNS